MNWNSLQCAFIDIKKRPVMYLGSNSVHDLEKFINGYGFALTVYDIQENFIVVDSMSFHDWIALRTHLYESTSGWANMLDSYYGSEEKALEMFFIHYDEFLSRSGTVIKYLEPKEIREWKWESVNGEKHYSYLTPYRVEIVKYTDDPGRFIRFLDAKYEIIDREEYVLNDSALSFRLINIPCKKEDWKNA